MEIKLYMEHLVEKILRNIVFLVFKKFLMFIFERERQNMNGGGREKRRGDTESDTGSRL